MCISSTSPQNVSLIGPLTTEIYYRTRILEQTDRHTQTDTQTDTQTESYTFPIQDIGSSKKKKSKFLDASASPLTSAKAWYAAVPDLCRKSARYTLKVPGASPVIWHQGQLCTTCISPFPPCWPGKLSTSLSVCIFTFHRYSVSEKIFLEHNFYC